MTIHDAASSNLFPVGEDRPGLTHHPFEEPARCRPWFLGDAPAPTDEPPGPAGRALMAEELSQIAFLRWAHCLLDFIGAGCRLTKQGAMFAVDRRALEQQCTEASEGFFRSPYGTSTRFDLAWAVLTEHGWLVREEGWVRPAGRTLVRTANEVRTEADLDDVRGLLAAALDATGRTRGNILWQGSADEDVLEALLVACGPDGLVLPDHPVDGVLIHCDESTRFLAELVQHPHIREVPRDRRSGHVAGSAVAQLARISRTVDHLVDCGLLRVEHGERAEFDALDLFDDDLRGRGRVLRGPLLLRGAVALVRTAHEAGPGHASLRW
ncbi:hypothetical protein CFK39_10315 [Brachybacterium avium]|uniref:Uncharacterized protein n=1 Tax=Brachybacterium avium TaxID=2017485 RepID=A0A220UDR5_9MICO|nr:hypothetical protein [Brachybacterium avium]ASK66140.1 hypothetical protein CFK39_10315 [Brachybacterium avium]